LRVIELLPARKSSIDALRIDLLGMSIDYRTHLSQDELGPTRADRARALKIVIAKLGSALSYLKSLNPLLRSLLSDELAALCSPAELFKIDILELHTADKHAVEAIAAAAASLGHDLSRAGRKREARNLARLAAAAQRAAWHVSSLDDTTDMDVVMWARTTDSEPSDPSWNIVAFLEARIQRLSTRLTRELLRLAKIKGTEARVSFHLLVARLCDLYFRETGVAATANPYEKTNYKGRPQTEAGRFVLAAIEVLRPPTDWVKEQIPRNAHKRASIVSFSSGNREQAVHTAMRAYVAAQR
jgi:hypothetical protein